MKKFILFTVIAFIASGLFAAQAMNAKLVAGHKTFSPKKDIFAIFQQYFGDALLRGENPYVGSEFCLACHADKSAWRDSGHHAKIRAALPQFSMVENKGIVADYNQNGVDDFMEGLDFNQLSSAFDAYKPNAPILGYDEASGYWIQIGPIKYHVYFTIGGTYNKWKQRYVTKIPVSDRPTGLSAGYYVLPVQFNQKTHSYVTYDPGHWYDSDGNPLFSGNEDSAYVAANGKNYDKGCAGCHTTAMTVSQDEKGEYVAKIRPAVLTNSDDPGYFDYDLDGIKDMVNVGCEACHGPGGQHISHQGDPEYIINPETDLDAERANMVCGRCHVRGKDPSGTYSYPYDVEANKIYEVGEDLNDYFEDHAGYWPDGKNSKKHHQQYYDFMKSSKPTFQFHQVRCYECHDEHLAEPKQIRKSINEDGLIIPTENDNNTLCLACHATHGHFEEITKEMVANYEENVDQIAKIVSNHTHHPYAPDRKMGLSRCSKCHMPKVAKSAIAYDIHSHTFEPIPPSKTLDYQEEGGMPNACATCHGHTVDVFDLGFDHDYATWNEPFDVDNATLLMEYYGPGGIWWDTNEEGEEGK